MANWTGNTDNKFLQLPNRTVAVYNLWDSYNTAQLFFALRDELADPLVDNWRYYSEWVQPLLRAVLNMTRRGLLLDRKAKREYQLELNRELAATDQLICQFADGVGFTYTDKFPNSDSQVAKLLYEHLGLRGGKRTEGGRGSADLEALTRLLRELRVRDEPCRELLYNLFHRSRLQTIKERYLKLDPHRDGRVRAIVKPTGTKTFRYAYAEPPLQQYPPECRHFFVSGAGYVYLSADYAQLEARILAILAGDSASLAAFAAGEDIHGRNACDLFGLPDTEWQGLQVDDRYEPYRNFAKSYLYGISYGGSAETMKTKLYCPCPRCVDKVAPTVYLTRDRILEAELRWFAAHPAVRIFQRELCEFVRRNHYYQSPFGVRRYVSKPWGPELEREVKNIPEQLNAALLINRAQVRLDRMSAPIVLQNHDQLLFQVPESPGSGVDQWAADIRGVMEAPVPALDGYSFPVDLSIGSTWGNLEDLTPTTVGVVCA